MPASASSGSVGDTGFVEFTVNLITGVMDALVAANTRQIQSFVDLVEESSQTLQQYTAAQQTALVGTATIATTSTLTADQVRALANLLPTILGVPLLTADGAPNTAAAVAATQTQPAAPAGPFITSTSNTALFSPRDALYAAALQAALSAIAGSQYQALQQMVKMGFSRIVLDSGVIETRLTFTTHASSSNQSTAAQLQTQQLGATASLSTQGKLAKYVSLSASANYSKLSVNMANQVHRDITGSSVQIFGRVELRLKSDYMPLSK
jgi:hypothetical protein